MIKVIIADDEARVCNLIRMLIDWEQLGMELVGMAANGLEALELVRELHPDILITDIRMPGCHGLELIERAKSINAQLEVVIISGYAHFEYAQSAIRFGVGDYLLKPINQRELMDTLKKLGDRCVERKRLGSEVEQLRKSSAQDTQQLQNRLMQDLMSGALEETSQETLSQKYRFRMQGERMQIVLLAIDYDCDQTPDTSVRIVEEKTAKAFSSELKEQCSSLLIHVSDGLCGALLCYLPEKGDAVRKLLRGCLNQLAAQGEMLGGFEFSMAISAAVDDVSGLRGAYNAARQSLFERLTQGTGRMLEGVSAAAEWKTDDMLRAYRQAVIELPERMSCEGMERAVDMLLEETGRRRGVRGADVFELVGKAGQLLLRQPYIPDNAVKQARFAARIAHAGSVARLFEILRETTMQETRLLIERQRSAQTRPIRLAREYVQQHYSEAITLEKVCEEVGFSVSYFSALFKKETGESFVHYLTRIRMDQAKELLAQTNLPVSQICVRVGYNDLKHFNQVFKKETDLSPGQYRKLYG